MASRNYLLIILDGAGMPAALSLDRDGGNAEHVHTSDVIAAVRSMRLARLVVRDAYQSVRVRVVPLDIFPGEVSERRDYKLSRAEAPLCVDPI